MIQPSKAQLTLDLSFELGDPVSLGRLGLGERFVRDSGTEGQLVGLTQGSATVKVLRDNGRWETTQWSLSTSVRRLRA